MNCAEENPYQKKILTIPNLLSLFRIGLIPIIVWLYVFKQENLWATAVLAISGITDIVDGYIARTYHMISDFGKVFDPFADKATQLVMLFCLFTRYSYMAIPAGLLLIKELMSVITGSMVIHYTGEVKGADWHGKLTTFILFLLVAAHFIWYAIPQSLSMVLVVLCSAMLILSTVLYSVRNIKACFGKK